MAKWSRKLRPTRGNVRNDCRDKTPKRMKLTWKSKGMIAITLQICRHVWMCLLSYLHGSININELFIMCVGTVNLTAQMWHCMKYILYMYVYMQVFSIVNIVKQHIYKYVCVCVCLYMSICSESQLPACRHISFGTVALEIADYK